MRFTLDGESFELTPELVRARLADHVPEDVREYWVEIDGTRWPVKQVISLATGVTDRQRFQSQSSRRWLQNLGFTIGGGSTRAPSAPTPRRVPATTKQPTALATRTPGRPADVVLVGCVKTKLDHGAPAKDLYVSDYFAKMRNYAEASGRPWFILSAEHGLISPEEWLEPYERYLPDTSREYRTAWGEKVAEQLEQAVGSLADLLVDIHAGATYVESVEAALAPRGAQVLDQLRGLSFGRRLSWYLQHDGTVGPGTSVVVSQLRDAEMARPLGDILAGGGAGLRVPGIYSWWVDEAGASDLALGLGHPIQPGLIYAGLAGATRSGGTTSSNTLWGRIATMHLGKKHEFSTLRRSLGSILAEADGQPTIDEEQLTRWMHAHLRVIPIPVADVDTLDHLESAILTELDPPLNLAKVPKTPLRVRMSALRKKYAGKAAEDGGDR
ncbi:DUF6884 domain-containing protein [Pimelobacter simplex]|uniref:DUF6884 domain-containing protein n=1 Tax=Nocardioides simplex TaxID=2045 RepID=UPI00214F869F|nr:DUF6884 domain-containing protein [Pimelobacter simplex]UUW88643.1 hypothetical protein M0M43_23305 [Pimelobacter simplex]UUW98148.1 hypothetical protein M0M48_11955 [Pimelobacter simplex]